MGAQDRGSGEPGGRDQRVVGRSGCARCERLEQELEATQRQLRERDSELRESESQLSAEQAEKAKLQAQLADLQRSVFGRKSESVPGGKKASDKKKASGEQDSAADGPDASPSAAEPAADDPETDRRPRGRQPGSPTPPREKHADLPVTEERLDVPEEQRRCPGCDTPYVPAGYKISRLFEIDWQALARELLRLRYRPACDCPEARPVIAEPAPRLGTSQRGISVWAWCLVQVYALFRTQAGVARDLLAIGLRLPTSTLSAGLRRLSRLFEPLEAAIARFQSEQAVAQADETSWPVQYIAGADSNKDPPPRGSKKPKYWLWICLAANTVRMRILPTRGADSAAELLDGLGRNGPVILMCDRYSAYKAFARLCPDEVMLVFCWAHVRRDWVRIGAGHPELEAWVEEWLERIGRLFELDGERRELWDPTRAMDAQSAAFDAVQGELETCLEKLFEQARDEGKELVVERKRLEGERRLDGAELARVDAKGRALGSLLKHEAGLRPFAADLRIPIDNNASERALRGPVIARLTSFGSGGPDGARAAGLLFGVLATVRMAGLNLYAFVLDWLGACARNGSEAPQDLDPWLPWRMSESRRQELSQPPARWWPQPAGAAAAADPALPKAA